MGNNREMTDHLEEFEARTCSNCDVMHYYRKHIIAACVNCGFSLYPVPPEAVLEKVGRLVPRYRVPAKVKYTDSAPVEIEAVLQERGKRYGDWPTHAKIAQDIKHAMMQGRNWADLPPYMKESLEMIAQKAGRILNGDPRHEDSWDDIAGYAKLSADAIRDEKEKNEKKL